MLFQHLIAHWRGLESDAGAADIGITENGKHFGPHFPHMRATPLHDMDGMRQLATKLVVIIKSHARNLSKKLTSDKAISSDGIDNLIRLM